LEFHNFARFLLREKLNGSVYGAKTEIFSFAITSPHRHLREISTLCCIEAMALLTLA
jgi:hypothetical protein